MKSPRELLGVSENASGDEIRRSYRRLVRKHHPDLNPEDPGAEERFKEIQRAYETLTSPGARGTRPRTPRPETRRRTRGGVEFSGNLSDLLEMFGRQRGDRSSGSAGNLRGMSEEDVSRLLERFGIDPARASKILVSFGDSADWNRRSAAEDPKGLFEKPFVYEDLKRPPKPPKPPKW